MSDNNYLARAPLLDPKQQVLGYKLAWQKNKGEAAPTDLRQLLSLVGERADNFKSGLLFLDARGAALTVSVLQSVALPGTVLMLNRDDLVQAGLVITPELLRELRVGLALCDADQAFLASEEVLLPCVTHLQLGVSHPELVAISAATRHAKPPVSVVLDGFAGWPAFDAWAGRGGSGFFGNLCATPRPARGAGALGPQTVLILQLMQMVQENADVRLLEQVLKRDATLSFKLFRYINSASFGIEVEVQSLRHAVSMLGYKRLFRWLSLLLATTNTAGFSPALLQAAIVRGRFVELLGQGLLSKGEAENLFVVGMFSLLDQLLGISIQEVLDQIVLPETITQALISREGVYGPFLKLAEACEHEDGGAAASAEALFMTATRVNQAHLSALAWAQSLKI